MTERDLLLPRSQASNAVTNHGCRKSWICIQSKAGTLIIIWTILFGIVYIVICGITAMTIFDNHGYALVDSVVTYPVIIMYAVLAVVAMCYPLIGFLADVSCGRFKVVMCCFSLVLFSFLVLYICLMAYWVRVQYYHIRHMHPAIIAIGSIAILACLIAHGGYHANFIQFGLDQLLSVPSEN